MITESSSAEVRGSWMARLLNGAVLGFIALSIVLQTISYYLVVKKGSEGVDADTSYLLGLLSMLILPGVVLAFFKLVLNIIRSFKHAQARFKAALYLVVCAWPLLLGVFQVVLTMLHVMPGVLPQEAPPSAQFNAGYDWAKEKVPLTNMECHGSQEFNRGCWRFIKEHRDALFLEGREWAKNNRPAKASQCTGAVSFIKGCRNYFTEHLEQPKPAGQGRYEGMTTAECKVEVNANYEALTRDFLENGNQHGADVTRYRSWDPDLKDCENYDKFAENTFMPLASNRLQQLLAKLKAGTSVTEEEKAQVLSDFTKMSGIAEQPYTTYYFAQFNEYQERMNGVYKEPVTVYPRISCEEYQIKIDELKKLDRERVVAMKALQSEDGRRITDGVTHDRLNQERLDMLWDWKLYNDGARAKACVIK